MDSPDNDWWLVHTGEYVLGLLDEQDAVVLERVMQHEPDIAKMIADWDNYFQPIADSLTPIEPPTQILSSLLANLPQHPPRSAGSDGASAVVGAASANGATDTAGTNDTAGAADGVSRSVGLDDGTAVMGLLRKNQQQTDRWRAFAGLAVVACLLLGLFVGLTNG